jgi:GNAT superfamily N-acetyltransferase
VLEIVEIASPDDEALLDAFHRGAYWDAFAAQHEPVAVWKRALWRGDAPYELTIRIAGTALRDPERREIAGGIVFERYPRSGCGLVTYLVIAPPARRQGLGKRLQREAALQLFAAGAPIVLGELNDPRRDSHTGESLEDKWRRLERNQAWGARVLDVRYIQPALAPGLARDDGLCLIALAGAQPLPATLPGAIVRDFVTELYAITEGGAPPPALVAAISDDVPLTALAR